MASEISVDELHRFKGQYVDFVNQLGAQHLREFEQRFGHLKVGLQALQASRDELLRHTGANFNVFTLLGLQRRETLLHSPMIADLLDPQGSHCQGTLFLDSFLRLLDQRFVENSREHEPLPPAGRSWTVRTEYWASDQGRLDVFLEHLTQPLVSIVIENKVDAVLQREQLKRYSRWLDQCRPAPCLTYLVYLTPNGGQPAEGERPDRALFCLSYRDDMVHWLNDCLPKIASRRVQETLQQYFDAVRNL